MAANKIFRFGPIALGNTYTTNLLNPGTITGGTNMGAGDLYISLKHLRAVNKTSSPHTVRLYLGATGANAAGTEIWFDKTVPANDSIEIFSPGIRLDVADFLVGGADAAASVTLHGEGEIGVK